MFEAGEIKHKWLYFLIVTNIIFLGIVLYLLFYQKSPVLEDTGYISIHIIGEVNYPNVYEVKENTTLLELIELAGGFTEDADRTINLARKLHDEMQINIPSVSENE